MDELASNGLEVEERWLVGRFQEMVREVKRNADEAEEGRVIHAIEKTVLDQGRDLLRRVAETEIQRAADRAEKKGRAPAPIALVDAETRVRTSASSSLAWERYRSVEATFAASAAARASTSSTSFWESWGR